MAAAGAGQLPPASAAAPAPAPSAHYQTASADAAAAPAPARAAALTASRRAAAQPSEPPAPPPATASAAPKAQPRSGWIIQIGAFPGESEARERLQSARSLAQDLLGKADPFTEPVTRGGETLYRARFAGLDERRAEAACKYLKRNRIDCFAVRN
jgi:D-alanyl-D-alanine carboxypeptidase